MEQIKVTLETLYDILRNEKKKEELQKLEDSFFIDVVNYLREKITYLNSKKNEDNIFAQGEKEKLEYELRSIKRILKELYEKREKKLLDIALNKSRTGSDLVDTSSMLLEEKEFYQKILGHLDLFRRGILFNLAKGEIPLVLKDEQKSMVLEDLPKVEPEAKKPEQTTLAPTSGEASGQENPGTNVPQKQTTPEVPGSSEAGKTLVKIIRPIPGFVWKDLKNYGPYEPGETIEIFSEVAELMVRKGRAEKI